MVEVDKTSQTESAQEEKEEEKKEETEEKKEPSEEITENKEETETKPVQSYATRIRGLFSNMFSKKTQEKAELEEVKEKEVSEEKEHIEEGKNVPETNRISGSFSDRHKLRDIPIKHDDVTKFLPEDFKPNPAASSDNSNSLLRELLSSLKEKDLQQLINPSSSEKPSSSTTKSSSSSNRFTPRAPGPRRDFSKGYRKPSVNDDEKFNLEATRKEILEDIKIMGRGIVDYIQKPVL